MTRAEERLEALAATCGPRVLAYLTRRTTPVEDAADVYQETLTTVWRKVHAAPDDPSEALPWMLAIARRTLANHRRGRARRLAATDRLAAELAVGGGGEPGGVETVRDALAGLGPDDREVLTLTYWEGLTGEQVATVLGIRPASARKRLERARQRVRAALEAPADPEAATTPSPTAAVAGAR